MSSLVSEVNNFRPVKAWCSATHVHVTSSDGRTIATPLWWYPFLDRLSDEQLNTIELMHEGIWWEAVDEGISVKSMLMGRKMPNAIAPQVAAE